MGEVIYLHRQRRRRMIEMPIANINITPLIDVMLVLLVMLIIAIPAATHQIIVPLPTQGTSDAQQKPTIHDLLVTSDGVYRWDGKAIADIDLKTKLNELAAAKDELRIETDGYARYERFNHLIALVKAAGVTKLGFVGNQRFKQWDKPA
ncbi:MAG: ExbD/TolR family protein [Sphingorhabdus sp.]